MADQQMYTVRCTVTRDSPLLSLRKEYLLIDCHLFLFFSFDQAEGRPPGDGAVRASAPGIHEKERHQPFQGK